MEIKTLEEVDQLKYLGFTQTKDNINKESKDQTGASTLGHGKASKTMV